MRQLIAGLASTPVSAFTTVMLNSSSESLYTEHRVLLLEDTPELHASVVWEANLMLINKALHIKNDEWIVFNNEQNSQNHLNLLCKGGWLNITSDPWYFKYKKIKTEFHNIDAKKPNKLTAALYGVLIMIYYLKLSVNSTLTLVLQVVWLHYTVHMLYEHV